LLRRFPFRDADAFCSVAHRLAPHLDILLGRVGLRLTRWLETLFAWHGARVLEQFGGHEPLILPKQVLY